MAFPSPQKGRTDTELKGLRFRSAKSRIAKNVLSNWGGMGVGLLVAFLMTPFVVHRLGNTAYGIWALVLQLTGYMGVFDVGVRSALVRFVSRYHAEGNQSAMSQLLSVSLLFYGALAVVTIALAWVLAVFALPKMHIPYGLLGEAKLVLMLAAATAAAGFTLGMSEAVLAGISRWDVLNGVRVGGLLFRTVLILVFLLKGYGLVSLAAIQLLTSVLAYGACAILAWRLVPGIQLSWRPGRGEFLRPALTHSFYAFLLSVGTKVLYALDAVVIAMFLPMEDVALYVIGFKLIEYLRGAANAGGQVAAPVASEIEVSRSAVGLQKLFLRGTKYLLLAVCPVNVGFLILGPGFIRLWMGQSYSTTSGAVLVILAIGQFVCIAEFVGTHILYGLSQHRTLVIYTGVEAALNLGLSLALVKPLGIYGVAWGTTIGAIVTGVILFPRAYMRALRLDWRTYVRASIAPILTPIAGLGVVMWALRSVLTSDRYLTLVVVVAMALAAYAILVWVFALDEDDHRKVQGLCGRIGGSLGKILSPHGGAQV